MTAPSLAPEYFCGRCDKYVVPNADRTCPTCTKLVPLVEPRMTAPISLAQQAEACTAASAFLQVGSAKDNDLCVALDAAAATLREVDQLRKRIAIEDEKSTFFGSAAPMHSDAQMLDRAKRLMTSIVYRTNGASGVVEQAVNKDCLRFLHDLDAAHTLNGAAAMSGDAERPIPASPTNALSTLQQFSDTELDALEAKLRDVCVPPLSDSDVYCVQAADVIKQLRTRLRSLAAPPSDGLVAAAKVVDWEQVIVNGGPPCFHLEHERFCLRAERWAGHGSAAAIDDHNFVSLADLVGRLTLAAWYQLNKELRRDFAALEQQLAEAQQDARRYRWWRNRIEWLTSDEGGIAGCAYCSQIDLNVIKMASTAELFDMIADVTIDAAQSQEPSK
jgi:hypothetical protein